ncbi:NAD(P)H-hydrate dehydratase [Nakamurella flavida]|uniref:Bifunctional NAD(P)H-hydrate repair enzyme n=1 Tax=Nakamurella flavida TaxID=363630 RepID=A0A938YM46_9ACTN|nr:NAD(P)H-hydrate dehydratase [Nakamurella flavida]MBM9475902.1 NAD(P)H-hydrate dehydratase [Nakamurella flavida]MBM9478438.1 NAD(P)H-hydrate dehydratase [Nakamurella flavida]MDP9777812.1 hydroxyethylthiazole kinase-like uncharacterized protein yjeF [Nakamurella flavida]
MIHAYTAESIRSIEQVSLDRDGQATLMRRAAAAVAEQVLVALPGPLPGRRVVVLVGPGNNGGDALLAGALLRRRGLAVTAVLTAPDRTHAVALAEFRRRAGRVLAADSRGVAGLISGADAIVDGLVGLSARPPLRSPMDALVTAANESAAVRVAVDLPSGVDPATGTVDGPVFAADVTVTFGAVKTGLLVTDAAGQLICDPIGMDPADAPGVGVDAVALTEGDLDRWLPGPGTTDDKYSGGLVGIVAGSPGYPGAAVLCTGGAVRTRPGMVRYAGAQGGAVLARWPEVVASETPDGAGRVQAWVVGPGLGTDDRAMELLRFVLGEDVPVLVDADALTLLAQHPDLLAGRAGRPTVLTPHEREFARIFPEIDLADRLRAARSAAATSGATVLLKGHRTVVAAPDGTTAVNRSGSSWLASAGSGDVLSGVIGSLLATGLEPWQAAAAGAFLHGRAGERAQAAGLAGASALWDFLGRPAA